MKILKVKCNFCGRIFPKKENAIYKHNFCCRKHFDKWNSKRVSKYNENDNPMNKKWTIDMRIKKRDEALERNNKECKNYPKYLGKHLHRYVAEQMLGRKLKRGEIVHHIDCNKKNNKPSNLVVLSSVKEHMHLHSLLKKGNKKEYGKFIKRYKNKAV